MATEMVDSIPESLTASRGRRDISPSALLLALLLALTCLYINLAKDSYMDDFRAFYVASLTHHDHLDPYVNHVNLSEKYADALWDHADSRFIYPPSAIFFAAPLSKLPYKWSKIAFGAVMTLLMVGILYGLSRRFPRQTFVILALFLTLPMFMNIDNGNIDVAMLALTLAAFYLKDGALAGACLGIAIAIKLSPALALLWFMTNKRLRTVVWSLIVSGGLMGLAQLRWGTLYFREFLTHLRDHVKWGMPELGHKFVTVTKIQDRALITPDGINSYQHDICGYLQSPLRFLGSTAGIVGLSLVLLYVVWLKRSERGRSLTREQSFFLFLVVCLFANPLLWTMGLVACFPLIVLLVDTSSTPRLTALMLLVPFFLTKQLAGNFNFTLWLIAAGYCLAQSGWLRSPVSSNADGRSALLPSVA